MMSQFPSATIRTTTPKVDLSRDFTGRSYPVPSWFPLTFRDPRKVSSLGGILSIFVLGWFTGEWFISFFVPTNLVLITKDACGVWKWIRDKNDDVYLHGECFQNISKHQTRLQSPMDDPPICTCCQESHGAHKWRRNKRMPARWCRCMATIAVFLPSITGKIIKWHLPSTIKLEDWRCTLANHYNGRFERIVCPDLILSIL